MSEVKYYYPDDTGCYAYSRIDFQTGYEYYWSSSGNVSSGDLSNMSSDDSNYAKVESTGNYKVFYAVFIAIDESASDIERIDITWKNQAADGYGWAIDWGTGVFKSGENTSVYDKTCAENTSTQSHSYSTTNATTIGEVVGDGTIGVGAYTNSSWYGQYIKTYYVQVKITYTPPNTWTPKIIMMCPMLLASSLQFIMQPLQSTMFKGVI